MIFEKPNWLKLIIILLGTSVANQSAATNIDSLLAAQASQEIGIEKVETTIRLASVCRSSGKINDAEAYFYEGLQLSRDIGFRHGEAVTLKNLGQLKLSAFITPYDEVTTLFMQSLAIFEELEDSSSVAECLLNLGVVNYSIGNYKNAAENFKQSIDNSARNNPMRATCQYLLGLCYSEIGNYDEAKALLEKSLVDYAGGDLERGLMVKSFLGKLMCNQHKYEECVTYLENALVEYQDIKDSSQIAPANAFLSSAYLGLKNYDEVIKHGEIALEKGDLYSGMIYYLEATNNLHQAYAATGDMVKAYRILNERQLIADSTLNNRVMASVANQKAKYEFEKEMVKEKARQRIDQELSKHKMQEQRILIYVFISGFIVLLIFSVVVFRQRSKIGHEKAASEKLLLNILPEEVAQELKEHGKAEARNYEGVSILFTDFKEFTQKAEKMSPTDLVELINTCFKAFDHICEKREIEKIKTIGDSYMAAAGFNVESKTAACRAVKAAIDMNRFVLEQLDKSVQGTHDNFQMRVGVNTGPVVAGIVGVKKFQYDLWGDTVNTASRMESHGEVGRVNISQYTYELVKDDPAFTFEHRGKVSAKGKGEIDMWFVDLV